MMRVATSFIHNNGRILLLRRSMRMKSMGGLWAAVSGVIEGAEDAMHRAAIEIREETGMRNVGLLASCSPVRIPHHGITVYPFLFGTPYATVRLNWENDKYAWIRPGDITLYRTVPYLPQMLGCLADTLVPQCGQAAYLFGGVCDGCGVVCGCGVPSSVS